MKKLSSSKTQKPELTGSEDHVVGRWTGDVMSCL